MIEKVCLSTCKAFLPYCMCDCMAFVFVFYLFVNWSFAFGLAHVEVIFHGELKLHLWFIAGDNTFFDVFRDFSNMASKEPDRLKRKFDSKDPNRQTPVWFDMIKI